MTTEAQVDGLGIFASFGFTLDAIGDDQLLLMHEGKRVASFIQTGATEAKLQEECALHLAKSHGWNGCLWSRKKEAN